MPKIAIHPTDPAAIGSRTLRNVPARLTAFLQGARRLDILQVLESAGYNDQWAQKGWALLEEFNALPSKERPPTDPLREATWLVEAFQNGPMARAQLLLDIAARDQSRFLFDNIVPAKGVGAAFNVGRFLERTKELRKLSKAGGATAAVRQALDFMVSAGISLKAEREVEDAIEVLRHVPQVSAPSEEELQLDEQRDLLLRTMHAWLITWTSIARNVTPRRDFWRALGITKRRSGRTIDEDNGEEQNDNQTPIEKSAGEDAAEIPEAHTEVTAEVA